MSIKYKYVNSRTSTHSTGLQQKITFCQIFSFHVQQKCPCTLRTPQIQYDMLGF